MDELKQKVLEEKYFLRGEDDNLMETREDQVWSRVSDAVASVERSADLRKRWRKNFYWLLEEWRFVPGGRITFGAGNTTRKVTLLNCYYMPLTGDSIEGIYKCQFEMAKTLAYGGGVGVDLSILRPAKSLVRNSAREASGVVGTAEQFSHTSGWIGQHGRIGALLLTLHCSHPDVFAFIAAKDDLERSKIRYANVSVLVTNKLMEAVKSDSDFELWYPLISSEAPPKVVKLLSEIKDMVEKLPKEDQVKFRSGLGCWLPSNVVEEVRLACERKSVAFIYDGHENFYKYDKSEWFIFYSSSTGDWEIRRKKVFSTVRAVDLWDLLIKHARDSAEPGVVFYDTILQMSTTNYNGMQVAGLNPCGEATLDPYGCCNLGSINLSAFVMHEFTDNADVDYVALSKAIRYGVRFLDDVLDYNKGRHPVDQQELSADRSRRLGLGVTGLADMLCKLQLRYDTQDAVDFVDKLFKRIKLEAYEASAKVGSEKGSFPSFNGDVHYSQPFYVGSDVPKYRHLRNSAILSIAPVGTGSVLTQTSSGIEPIFAISYTRRSESLSTGEFKVYHPLAQHYMKKFGMSKEEELPKYFVTSANIDYKFRVMMQSVIQKHVCQSISSTVSLPNDVAVDIVKQVYQEAHNLGCKGITVYRQGSREDILSTGSTKDLKQSLRKDAIVHGSTVKVRYSDQSVYVTLNCDDGKLPYEVFVNLGKSGSADKAMTEAIGRVVSLYLQSGGILERAIETLIDIRGGDVYWWSGSALYSLPDAIAKALIMLYGADISIGGRCPKCQSNSYVYEGGCWVCKQCGHSVCG